MTRVRLRYAGFTLLELSLVLFILGLVYALAAPALSKGAPGLDVRAAAQQLAAGLRKARSVAAMERREAVLVLDVEGRRFSVTGDGKTYDLPRSVELSMVTAQSEQTDDKTGRVRFYPDGSSTGGHIVVAIAETKQLVNIDWLTGRVSIE